jgi:peptidyl-prolyl cis-trans isomerase B (cyclophilin B)
MSHLTATIHTNKGDIHLKLHDELTPVTVASFVNLAKHGFYKGIKFHRVIPDFVIQAGCPNGIGNGGPGYRFEDEFAPSLRHNKAGILSMANAGPGTNGSQFFITHGPTPHLDNRHSVFGEVLIAADLDIVNAITQGDVIKDITIEGDDSVLMSKMSDRISEWNKVLNKAK